MSLAVHEFVPQDDDSSKCFWLCLAISPAGNDIGKIGYMSRNIRACAYSFLLDLVATLGLIEGFT